MAGTDLVIDRVLYMEIPFEVLAQRVTGRRICKECGAIFHTSNKPSKVEGVCDECGGTLTQRKDDTLEKDLFNLIDSMYEEGEEEEE